MKKIKALALLLAVVMVIGLMLPVFLAAINCETTVFCGGFRTVGRLPGIMPTIAVYLILSFFFRKDAMGVLNVLFAQSGLGPFYRHLVRFPDALSVSGQHRPRDRHGPAVPEYRRLCQPDAAAADCAVFRAAAHSGVRHLPEVHQQQQRQCRRQGLNAQAPSGFSSRRGYFSVRRRYDRPASALPARYR